MFLQNASTSVHNASVILMSNDSSQNKLTAIFWMIRMTIVFFCFTYIVDKKCSI